MSPDDIFRLSACALCLFCSRKALRRSGDLAPRTLTIATSRLDPAGHPITIAPSHKTELSSRGCGADPHHIRALAEALGRRRTASRFSPDMSKHYAYGNDQRLKQSTRRIC